VDGKNDVARVRKLPHRARRARDSDENTQRAAGDLEYALPGKTEGFER
jgi:hypothetical protein